MQLSRPRLRQAPGPSAAAAAAAPPRPAPARAGGAQPRRVACACGVQPGDLAAGSWNSSRQLPAAVQGAAAAPELWPGRRRHCAARRPRAAAGAPAGSAAAAPAAAARTTWTAPDGARFEVLELRATSPATLPGGARPPPVVLVHGLFRAAWYFEGALMPALAAAGHDVFALSLRGQGGSEAAAPAPSAEAAPAPFPAGVPLAVNVADIGAFISEWCGGEAPLLLGHSLGGMVAQEYLLRLAAQQQQQQQGGQQRQGEQHRQQQQQQQGGQQQPSAAAASMPHVGAPLPWLAGAVLLASACAGSVMAFGRFVADVGLPEFLWQMYVVATSAHLRDLSTARYCWWQEEMGEEEAARHFEAIRGSSKVAPYVPQEVASWKPAPPDREALPPVLALGGAADRIIRPFQVAAAGDFFGAEVVVLEGVTHDCLLGPQADAVSARLVEWARRVSAAGAVAAAAGAPAPVAAASAQVPPDGAAEGERRRRRLAGGMSAAA